MPALDRLGARLKAAGARQERLLVLYLTLGDPLTDSLEFAVAAVAAGADVLELGLPTPGTRPRGADIALSFDRARQCPPGRLWELVRELRAGLPDTPLLSLVYPQTVADLGVDRLLELNAESDVDGLVLTDPDGRLTAGQVAAAGLSAVPLVTPGTDAARRRRLEDTARHLTYQALAERTGARLDPAQVGRSAGAAALGATKPFLAGFGIRDEHDIRAASAYAAGVVIGSELYRGLAAAEPATRMPWTRSAVRRWKAATVLSGTDLPRSGHAR
ncbi:tryptophan synthase subunit alpha [Streptosporangium sp. NBC_01639]|uniref:tryptophan synthase subunit alpha n=1 Tax=Streptosporangium sp. NBC_01639 TaxID=2975948 RepID=UPI003864E8EE|nr:tryptophan synthase subunit alpha [Streptosporangium sp. NBC_01639]